MRQGHEEIDVFKKFHITLLEDSLFHIFGPVLQESTIFEGANKSFIKALLIKFKHEFYLKRGVISQVNNVHCLIFFIFKGEVQVVGPDKNCLNVLPVGSIFGHLDNVPLGRETLTYGAKGHVEILCIKSSDFYKILSNYKNMEKRFQLMTKLNVDYIVNKKFKQNSQDENDTILRLNKGLFCIGCTQDCLGARDMWDDYCPHANSVMNKIVTNKKFMLIWKYFFVGIVCFGGFAVEIYQKTTEDTSLQVLVLLYTCDVLFSFNILLTFYSPFEDERGFLVTHRMIIASQYINETLKFGLDLLSIIPFEISALACTKKHCTGKVFTFARFFRLLRIIKVLNHFNTLQKKLYINVWLCHILYVIVWIFLTWQGFVFVVFLIARLDPTQEIFRADLLKNCKFAVYIKQVTMILQFIAGSPGNNFKVNNMWFIITASVQMILSRFIMAYFIAQICATMEIILHTRNIYNFSVITLRRNMYRRTVSPTLASRIFHYTQLLWMHHKGTQFPCLLEVAPYYLKEGIIYILL